MHGRIKVRTTAEQAEAKRKERDKKLKIYREATDRINEKRKNGEMDKEALSLTEQVLGGNPDVSTLWNFRREIFLHMKDDNPQVALQDICQRELSFLRNCLQVNPKSYSVWYHRQWIMEFMPQPNWKEELHLCNLFLSYDARNFHCWDYRRYTVNKANISPEDEFNFSTEKIKENFSNYSSWHYRSKLLPLIHPHKSGDVERVEEDALMKEFDLAQNAFFTDPYDQSAWFYHRWLLGRARPLMYISCLYVQWNKTSTTVIVTFSQPIQVYKESPFVVANGQEVAGEWSNCFQNNNPSTVWCSHSSSIDSVERAYTVKFMNRKLESCVVLQEVFKETGAASVGGGHEPDKLTFSELCDFIVQLVELYTSIAERATESSAHHTITCNPLKIRAELTAVHSSVLQQELDSCRLLLQEEPDNKWTMLTMVLLMRALDPLKHEQETNLFLEKLVQVDGFRKGYYRDLRRKFQLENVIERHHSSKEKGDRAIDLSNMDLTYLSHMDQLVLMKEVNLSQNQLSSLDECNLLQCVKILNASKNDLCCITKRNALRLGTLEDLSLADNNISHLDCLKSLQYCSRLKKLDLRGNPCCQSASYRLEVKSILVNLQELDEQQIHPS